MTDSNIDPEVIKTTQDTLGKFVKKPPLTEKLLKKPPFKFIHDVVKVVKQIKTHHWNIDPTEFLLFLL